MSETESTQLWDDEDDDLQPGQFSESLAALSDQLQSQQGQDALNDDEEAAMAQMYEEGVSYEPAINDNGEPAEVSYSDLTEEDAFTMDHGTLPADDAGVSLDDELDALIPDEEPMMAAGDTDLSLDDELDNLIPDEEPVAAMSSGDTELALDDDDYDQPLQSYDDSEGEMSLGAELDAILNEPAADYAEPEAEQPAYADEVEEVAFEEEAPLEQAWEEPADEPALEAEPAHEEPAYADQPAEDEGYLAEEEPAEDFAAYPAYEEAEEEIEYEEAPAAAAPMPVMGGEGTDDFNLATLTQLVDEIRQESQRVAEMKESVARALNLIQEMSESLKS